MADASLVTREWAERWQRSWDHLEASLVSDRELRIQALIDLVDATGSSTPTVLDLACGPGTVTRRLLDRLPVARSIAVDVDPVLLTIASATFAGDDRVVVVPADLRDPTWVELLPDQRIDAVLTSTALHWLPEETVRRLYCDLSQILRPGGVLAHAELMPLVGVYSQLGYDVLLVSAATELGIERLRNRLAAKQSVVTGQSGVGKSSLLNGIEPELGREQLESLSQELEAASL